MSMKHLRLAEESVIYKSARVRFQKSDVQNIPNTSPSTETLQSLKEDIIAGMKVLIQKEIRNNQPVEAGPRNRTPPSPKLSKYSKCHYCNWSGHWIGECRKFRRDFPDTGFRAEVKSKLIKSKEKDNSKQSSVNSNNTPSKSPLKDKSPNGRVMVTGSNSSNIGRMKFLL